MRYLIVFLGAGIGGALRHGVNVWSAHILGMEFPFGTLFVNVVGSLFMGLIAGWFAFYSTMAGSQELRLFLTTGILGGFTTFSAFSLDVALLWERHDFARLFGYVSVTFIASVGALFLGLFLMRQASP